MLITLSTIGATIIITQSYAFKWLRKLVNNKFIKCSLCVGFWVGLILYSIKYTICFDSVLYGLIGSISSYTYYLITKDLE